MRPFCDAHWRWAARDRKQKFQIDRRRWRLKLHENGTQGAVAIGVGHLQLVSGNQMETHLLNAIVNHGFFRLGSPSEFCRYGHPIPSICNTLVGCTEEIRWKSRCWARRFLQQSSIEFHAVDKLLGGNPVPHSLTHPFLGDEITKYYVTTEAFS